MIRCVAFDFDGTLVMSNAIKREAFFAVTAHVPDGAAAMTALLADPPGDRYAIFAAFAAPRGLDAEELADAYGQWCEDAIQAAPERAGAGRLLAELAARGIPAWINSATPEAPLRATVRRRYPAGTFAGVRGGHARKLANLQAIAAAAAVAPAELLMVGDGVDDLAGATAFGCRFAGIAGGTLAASGTALPLVTDLADLIAVVSEVPA